VAIVLFMVLTSILLKSFVGMTIVSKILEKMFSTVAIILDGKLKDVIV